MSTTTISIDQVFELLSDAQHSLRKKEPSLLAGPTGPTSNLVINTDTVSKQDILQALIYIQGKYSYEEIFKKAIEIIYSTELSSEEKEQYIASFIEYFSLAKENNANVGFGSNSISGFAQKTSSIGQRTNEYFDNIAGYKGDISQIGFYSILESDVVSSMPTIIPSSISIQEQLLNQPVPVVRSKSVGVIPDHRSKHLVSIDILYPNFESFSSTEAEYPSFINLLNMFKFIPINSIYSPILSSAFISEYTFPKLFDLVKQVFTNEEFEDLEKEETEEAKIRYIANQLSVKDLTLSEIKELFSRDDTNLDIGLSAVADNILTRKEIDAGLREENFDSENLKDFIVNYQDQAGFPVPVAFKSASVQSHADMPGAVIARFVFGIINSPAFPYGSIMYRNKEGKPSYNPSDCYYGIKYVNMAARKILSQSEIDANDIQKTIKGANLQPIGPNDLRLYYFDFENGAIVFDSANPRYHTADGRGIILEKISGAFNTKSVEVPLMGSKFPFVQYIGMNSNSCQLIFNVTNKQVIADFMAMKARIVDSEKNQSISHSYAIVENTFINSLGISRITPQSIAIDSDPDVPDLYRLTITFVENYQDIDTKEKLRLEKGIGSISNIKEMWKYFYDLYFIWYQENFVESKLPTEKSEKLDKLMNAIGIKRDYRNFDNEAATILNPGRGPHDVYYGPLLLGIIEEYAKKRGATSATGYLEYDFPEALKHPALDRDHFQINLLQIMGIFPVDEYDTKNYSWFGRFLAGIAGGQARRQFKIYPSVNQVLFDMIFSDTLDIATGYTLHGSKNLVDMFHKNNVPISREIWESSFQAVLDRKYTKGSDILVSYSQVDKSFAMLYTLISSYADSYKFDISDNKNGDQITSLEYDANHIASLNISKLKKEKEEIESLNKQIVNLYPDLYLPTYEDLIRDEEEVKDPNKRDAFIEKFLIAFAPKHGDSGTIPNFENFKQLQMTPKQISEMLSVTLDHYIDPDIFYYRQRDKPNMHTAVTQTGKNKKQFDEVLKTGRTVDLPVDYTEMVQLARERLEEKGIIGDEYILNSDEKIKMEISKMLEEGLSSFVDNSEANAGDLKALESFSPLGLQQAISAKKSEEIKEYLKSIAGVNRANNLNNSNEQANQADIIHLEFTTADGQLIGDVIPDKSTKYRVLPGVRVGGKPTYYTHVDDMSFALEDDFKLATTERNLLHTPDLTDSVLKSFPTVRVYFIEEDRDQSYERDDFYGFGDVIEFNMTSHIYDNDVCRMKLANFSGVLTTMQFTDFAYTTDVKKSAQNQNRKNNQVTAGKKEPRATVDEAREKFLRKIALRPGVHIMVKLGYGNNLDTLKTVFTGEIAEVKPGPIVELVAQGYQTELHNEFGGFMEEGFWESGLSIFEGGVDETLKFGFSKIINYILLMNDGQNKRLSKNNMMHLGEPFSVNSYRKGVFGKINPDYEYDSFNQIQQYLGARTVQDAIAEAQGETFSWFDSFMESYYFGFSGTDISRNIYVATSNSSSINIANEWLITNAPVIDSLREAVRYMPNFIATVVPYEQDATLFIGDPANVFQYRKPNRVEHNYEAKFNSSFNAIRNQNYVATKNNDLNRIIDSINRKNVNFALKISEANFAWNKRILSNNGVIPNTFNYPKGIADQIDEFLLLPLTGPLSLPPAINPVVIGKIFCNFLSIPYETSRQDEYIRLFEQIINLDLREFYIYKNAPTEDDERSGSSGLSLKLYDRISLDGYRHEIYNDATKRTKYLPIQKGRNTRILGRKTLINDIKALLENNERILYPVVLKDKVFSLGSTRKRDVLDYDYGTQYIGFEYCLQFRMFIHFLDEIIKDRQGYIETEAAKLSQINSDFTIKNVLPWNYKVFRDHHILTSENDLIANNITASESDMWSAVSLRVPMDTVETINGFTWQAFQWGINEGGVDRDAGTYRIDSDQTFGIYPNKTSGGVNYRGFAPGPKDILENFTEINATTPSLAQNVLKFRLAQGLSKMYRGNIICLGRNIKPYDQIQIVDNVNNMYGKVMAERVIQHFSATTGWTTTIVPCALSTVNSQQASYDRTTLDKWMYTLGQGKTGRYLMNAFTIATFGSAGLGFMGGLKFLGKLPFGFIKRVFTGTFGGSSQGLWSAAKYPYTLAKKIAGEQNTIFAARFAARFGLNPLKLGGSGVMLATTGISGTANIIHQFTNMSISQSVVLKNSNGTIHQPCHMSLLNFNGGPFIAGLEDPINSFSNTDAWAQLSEEFEYAWREWWERPDKPFKADDVTALKILGPRTEE